MFGRIPNCSEFHNDASSENNEVTLHDAQHITHATVDPYIGAWPDLHAERQHPIGHISMPLFVWILNYQVNKNILCT